MFIVWVFFMNDIYIDTIICVDTFLWSKISKALSASIKDAKFAGISADSGDFRFSPKAGRCIIRFDQHSAVL